MEILPFCEWTWDVFVLLPTITVASPGSDDLLGEHPWELCFSWFGLFVGVEIWTS